MKRRTKFFLLGSVLFVALFVALWKVSAPIRMRQQFEAEAMDKMQNVLGVNGETFRSVRVTHFIYHHNEDFYDVGFTVNYINPKNGTLCRQNSGFFLYKEENMWRGIYDNPFASSHTTPILIFTSRG